MGTKAAVRVEDLDTLPPLPDGHSYELSRGEVIIIVGRTERRHERIKDRVARLFHRADAVLAVGEVYVESMFVLNPETQRSPGIAFVSRARLDHLGDDPKLNVAPDLAIEIISPTDTAADVEQKVIDYLAAGVREVWQIFSDQHFIRIRTRDGIRDLGPTAAIETPILPGFSPRVSELLAD